MVLYAVIDTYQGQELIAFSDGIEKNLKEFIYNYGIPGINPEIVGIPLHAYLEGSLKAVVSQMLLKDKRTLIMITRFAGADAAGRPYRLVSLCLILTPDEFIQIDANPFNLKKILSLDFSKIRDEIDNIDKIVSEIVTHPSKKNNFDNIKRYPGLIDLILFGKRAVIILDSNSPQDELLEEALNLVPKHMRFISFTTLTPEPEKMLRFYHLIFVPKTLERQLLGIPNKYHLRDLSENLCEYSKCIIKLISKGYGIKFLNAILESLDKYCSETYERSSLADFFAKRETIATLMEKATKLFVEVVTKLHEKAIYSDSTLRKINSMFEFCMKFNFEIPKLIIDEIHNKIHEALLSNPESLSDFLDFGSGIISKIVKAHLKDIVMKSTDFFLVLCKYITYNTRYVNWIVKLFKDRIVTDKKARYVILKEYYDKLDRSIREEIISAMAHEKDPRIIQLFLSIKQKNRAEAQQIFTNYIVNIYLNNETSSIIKFLLNHYRDASESIKYAYLKKFALKSTTSTINTIINVTRELFSEPQKILNGLCEYLMIKNSRLAIELARKLGTEKLLQVYLKLTEINRLPREYYTDALKYFLKYKKLHAFETLLSKIISSARNLSQVTKTLEKYQEYIKVLPFRSLENVFNLILNMIVDNITKGTELKDPKQQSIYAKEIVNLLVRSFDIFTYNRMIQQLLSKALKKLLEFYDLSSDQMEKILTKLIDIYHHSFQHVKSKSEHKEITKLRKAIFNSIQKLIKKALDKNYEILTNTSAMDLARIYFQNKVDISIKDLWFLTKEEYKRKLLSEIVNKILEDTYLGEFFLKNINKSLRDIGKYLVKEIKKYTNQQKIEHIFFIMDCCQKLRNSLVVQKQTEKLENVMRELQKDLVEILKILIKEKYSNSLICKFFEKLLIVAIKCKLEDHLAKLLNKEYFKKRTKKEKLIQLYKLIYRKYAHEELTEEISTAEDLINYLRDLLNISRSRKRKFRNIL